ncbi:YdcH family protein [Uliginosibacterium paludis]|uniref:YdcH family protein n=1 Tax=Uliginosibacterium paludis TaxID=1615952 RepID=A0ABV2CVR2_9RHOO
MSNMFESATNLHFRLDNLRAEHRELDEAIMRLCSDGTADRLTLQRLKKRRLLVKDRIVIIERTIGPETQA